MSQTEKDSKVEGTLEIESKLDDLGLKAEDSIYMRREDIIKIHDILDEKDKLRTLDHNDPYYHFKRALKKGRFPNNGRHAIAFLEALDAGPEQRKVAEDLFEYLLTNTISGMQYKSWLQDLAEAREEDELERQAEVMKEVAEDSGSVSVAKITSAETANQASETTEKPKSKFLGLDWLVEKAPDSLVAKLDTIEGQIADLGREYDGLKTKQLELWEKYQVAEGEEKQDLENQLTLLYKKMQNTDNRIGKKIRARQEHAEEYENYLMRTGKRAMSIRSVQEETGIKLAPGAKIQFRADGRFKSIQVTGVQFLREDNQLDDSAGNLVIHYLDENGSKKEMGYGYFRSHLVNNCLAHEEISDTKEMRARLGKFDQGLSFYVPKNDLSFTISHIDPKEQTVRLDREVSLINGQDHAQSEFSFGEFYALVKRNRYTPDLSPSEMLEVIADKHASHDELVQNAQSHMGDEQTELSQSLKEVGVENRPFGIAIPEPGAAPVDIIYTTRGGRDIPVELKTNEDGTLTIEQKKPPKVLFDHIPAQSFIELEDAGQIAPAAAGPGQASGNGESAGAQADEAPAPEEPAQADSLDPKKKHAEALPYKEIFKHGGMIKTERSLLKTLWTQTRFMSVGDFWEMGKTMYEYYQRRWERRQKERYSTIGAELPFFAPEFQRVREATEHEQVNQFKEAIEDYGILQVQELIRTTSNPDEFKACFLVLTEKGQLRWDDIGLWRNINRFVDSSYAIPIPTNGDPNTQLSETDKRRGFDFLQDAIDSLWGEGQYTEWYSKNKSTYDSNAKGFYARGKELEGVEGGHARHLKNLLQIHKNGGYVDPHEYEGLILHAIDAGKSSMQAKLYYMVQGVAAVNGDGRTIMSVDRMAHLNSEMLHKFPILEYITASIVRSDGGKHRFTIDDYKRWRKFFDGSDDMNCEPNKNVDDFLWKYVIPSDSTQNRINKDMRNGENLDHDDMFAYLPPASVQVIEDSCKATTGSKKFLTVEGYANVFPGFSQYIQTLGATNNRNKLVEAINSYVRFEAVMTNRWKKGNDSYQRLDGVIMNNATIVSSDPPVAFTGQLNPMVMRIAEAYAPSYPKMAEIARWMQVKTGGETRESMSPRDIENQKKVQQALEDFAREFPKAVKTDNGAKLVAIVNGTTLTGMPDFLSDEEKDARKSNFQNQLTLAY